MMWFLFFFKLLVTKLLLQTDAIPLFRVFIRYALYIIWLLSWRLILWIIIQAIATTYSTYIISKTRKEVGDRVTVALVGWLVHRKTFPVAGTEIEELRFTVFSKYLQVQYKRGNHACTRCSFLLPTELCTHRYFFNPTHQVVKAIAIGIVKATLWLILFDCCDVYSLHFHMFFPF